MSTPSRKKREKKPLKTQIKKKVEPEIQTKLIVRLWM
jgi:hypothetical protein